MIRKAKINAHAVQAIRDIGSVAKGCLAKGHPHRWQWGSLNAMVVLHLAHFLVCTWGPIHG